MIYVLVPGHALDFTVTVARGTHVVMSAISAPTQTIQTCSADVPVAHPIPNQETSAFLVSTKI